MMRILQGNLHRSKTADNLLTQLRRDLKTDIIAISEQYENKNGPGWFADALGTAAIWIPNVMIVNIQRHGVGRGFVWVKCNGFTLVSCYFTPNETISEFREKLDGLEDTVRELEGAVVMTGDFNAKALEWGMTSTNSRGRQILEMAARLGLNVMNVGNTSTFRRPGYGETIPDVTFASESLAAYVKNWRVIEDYTGSDHQYIIFDLQKERRVINGNRRRTPRWNATRLNEALLTSAIDSGKDAILEMTGPAERKVDATMRLIHRACDASMPRIKKPNGHWKPVYWWTNEIADLRRRCLHLRRQVTRGRRRNTEPTENTLAEYRTAKLELKKSIKKSKKQKWEELRRDVNMDPWGLGYKVVMRKIGAQTTSPALSPAKMENIVNTLFPTHPRRDRGVSSHQESEIPLFSEEELLRAVSCMQNKKAPGPDGIPAEVLKVIARTCPELLLNMYNICLEDGFFHKTWKTQRLVLISKGKVDPDSPSAYRPLCMLDTAGKLLERMLKPRLSAAVERAGDLSERQHGFRKGHSTIGAVEEVVRAAQVTHQGNHYSRKVVVLATLDVRNAFNSARWCDMLNALENNFRVPQYLRRMVEDYLSDRELIYDTTEGPRRKEVNAGAAQGSILGPDLWNISYDGILRMEMPDDTFLVGYADDIAAVITARDTEDAKRRLNQVMRRVHKWMEDHGLSLAMEKTEIVLLTRRQIPTMIELQVGQEVLNTKEAVKYLGVRIDTKLTFWQQIKFASERAAKTTLLLSRLMANVGGPTESKRRLLMSVTHSILLYGSEIWADALKKNKYRKKMAAVQRIGALRITSSYRTVSEPAVLIIAGVAPIDLQAAEKKYIHRRQAEVGKQAATVEAKELTKQCWQERWNSETRGRWTARLIGTISEWVERKSGEVNYYLTQFLTGHGYFNAYLHKMGKAGAPCCQYGDSPQDDANHTFFECSRWQVERRRLESEIGNITVNNIIGKMCNNEDTWELVCLYIEEVLKQKKREQDQINSSLERENQSRV